MISTCVLIRSSRGRSAEVVQSLKRFKEVKNAFSVLGRYDVVVDLEIEDFEALGNVIMKMGLMTGVVFTETLVELVERRK